MMLKSLKYQPWNNGRILQTETGPKLANCPSEHSRKNKGKPANASIIVYGIKKAPEKQRDKFIITFESLGGTLTKNIAF